MSELRQALNEGNHARAADLIWRRLAGDHLDAPFDIVAGESPGDYIHSLHEAGFAEPLACALANLLDAQVPTAIDAMADKPSLSGAARIAELLHLLERTRYPDPGRRLERICERLMLLPRFEKNLAAMQLAAFKTYITLDLEHKERLLTLFSPALDQPELLPAYCIAAAKADPMVFFDTIARHLLPELGRRRASVGDEFDFLSESVRIAANLLIDRQQMASDLVATLDGFFTHVAQSARSPNGRPIRSAVLKGLSRTSLPAAFLRNFEAAFWDALPPASAALSRSEGRSHLRGWLQNKVAAPKLNHAVGLGLNAVPYGEAGLFRLLALVLRVGWDFRLNIVHDDYSHVGASLGEGRLSIAVHNSSIERQVKALPNGPVPLFASPPLLTFQNYDMLLSQAALRSCYRNPVLPPSTREIVERLLDGGMLDLSKASSDGEEAVTLMKQGGVYFLKDTDTQAVALLVAGERAVELDDDEHYIHSSINPDEGLEQLLDGEVLLYFGGAIQSHYALANCANRISMAGRVEMATELKFYVDERQYLQPDKKATYDFILSAWNITTNIWKILRHRNRAPKDWGDLPLALREEIIVEVNRSQDMPNGFVSDFDDLFDLIREHDTIHIMPETASFEAISKSTVTPLISAKAKNQ
jgi:hypothetical protein